MKELDPSINATPIRGAELSWEDWLRVNFSEVCTSPFAPRHKRLWDWFEALRPNELCRPRVEIWPRGGGKALAIDTLLPTPTGFIAMGDVRPGDILLDHLSRPTRVTAVSPIEIKSAYRITFDDRSSIIASGDHLWTVLPQYARMSWLPGTDWATETWDYRDRLSSCSIPGCNTPTRRNQMCATHLARFKSGRSMEPKFRWKSAPGCPVRAVTMTTEELLNSGIRNKNARKWAIPTCAPLQGSSVDLPIHPYVLGVWLGDGTAGDPRIASGHIDADEMQQHLEDTCIEVTKTQHKDGNYTLKLGPRFRNKSRKTFIEILRDTNLLHNKHIPKVYLRAPIYDRMELLRGLMDTDGGASWHNNSASIVTIKYSLACEMRELIVSLGYRVTLIESRAKLYTKDCGPVWSLRIAGYGPEVFKLQRKCAQLGAGAKPKLRSTGRVRYIEAIEKLEDQPVKCIVVDSPGSLFLAGENWIPTHNSASVELGVCRMSVTLNRRFVLYVSETQKQADEHVQTISTHLERLGIERAVNRYGVSRGWTGSRLRTSNGFNVMALGLDAATRGVKFDRWRPDLIIMDDIDGRHDSDETRAKKIEIITTSLMPAGSSDCAIIFLQNLIYSQSIAAQLAYGKADFLHNRTVSDIEVAVVDLTVDRIPPKDDTELPTYRITGGIPTWEGQSLEICQAQINLWGFRAFMRESQQEVAEDEGGLWKREHFENTRVTQHPPLVRIVVAIDPNASEGGDEAGIMVGGCALIGQNELNPKGTLHCFLLEDCSVDGGPKRWAEAAVAAFNRHNADAMVAEKNNGGDMVAITIRTIRGAPYVKLIHASRGKITRAEPVQKLYEDGRAHNVGHFVLAEQECCSYIAGMPSPNRMDALVWLITELALKGEKSQIVRTKGVQRTAYGFS